MKNKEIISKMTLEEKCSLLSGKDFWRTQDIPGLGIPSIFLADGPHGIRKQAAASDHLGLNESLKATCFPTASAIANSWDEELGEAVGRCIGREAVAQKVNVVLGPGLNIKRNPLCGRNFEYFSEDPYLAGKMAAAYTRGIQSSGVSACLKHFAANNQELRRMVSDSVLDERTLREIYLTGFEIAVKEGKAKTVMTSYNKVQGEYANENGHLLRDILRGEWGFEGVIVTDWGGNNDRIKALKCGNELEMPSNGGDTDREIAGAVKSGLLSESKVDECVDRLLTLVFDTEKVYNDKNRKDGFDKDAHHETARRAAEESVVLLKNENSVLPLGGGAKVAVIGDFAKKPCYQGGGSSTVNPTAVDDTVSSIGQYPLSFIGYEPGFKRYGQKSKRLIKRACRLAAKADVVLLYLGIEEAEGMDRACMKLPANQTELLDALAAAGKKLVAVLACGSPVETEWADKVQGIVLPCLSGQAGAKAVLNVLTGRVNPSGKLAESYAYRYGDCPSAANFPGRGNTAEYREGIFVGYRYYGIAKTPVRFPFGYGLSYTSFEYSGITVNDGGVTFTVANTGAVAGAEVAQLYIGLEGGEIFRPVKELKGFKKVYLRPGEAKTVTIPFDDKAFRYFNTKTNAWETEPGVYDIMIGASSEDIRLRSEIRVEGTEAEIPYDKTSLPSYYSGKADNVPLEEFEALLGRKAPRPDLVFYKKNRIAVDYNTTISQLRYARGWAGRFLSGAIGFGIRFLKGIGKRGLSNTLVMGPYHMPMRGLSRMSGGIINWKQLDGLILMFNGRFFKGLNKFAKEGRVKKKRIKAEKKRLNP